MPNMDFSFLQLIGAIFLIGMIVFFYRRSILSILNTPKESFMLSIPIIILGVMFYFFFKFKGF